MRSVPDSSPAESRPGYVLPLSAMLAVQSIVSFASMSVPVLAPAAAPTLGVDAAMVGWYVSLVYLAAIVSAVIGGSMVGRFGALRLSQICLVLAAAGHALLAGGLAWLLVPAALVSGFGYGPATPSSSQILARVSPPHLRNLIFSIKQTGVPIGGMLAGAAVPPLVGLLGWQGAALVIAGLCLGMGLVLQPTRAALDTDRADMPLPRLRQLWLPVRAVLADAALRRHSLASTAYAANQLALTTFLVVFLIDRAGYSLVAAGLVLTVAQVAGVAGRIGWGLVADRYLHPVVVLVGLGIVIAASTVAIGFVDGSWPVLAVNALAAIYGLSAAGWNGVFLAEVARIAPPGQVGEMTGGSAVLTFAGSLLGPALFTAVLLAAGSYAVAYLAIGALALAASLYLLRNLRS